ncbi:hypothetical protein MMC13_001717 [Lambiella insularis]|nr:hypothetical protein [Lambiella insularis]
MAMHYGYEYGGLPASLSYMDPSVRYGEPPRPVEIQTPPEVVLFSVPRDLTLQPTWVHTDDFINLRQNCVAALHQFPQQGEIHRLPYPFFNTYGSCTIGIYFSDPKPNADPAAEDQWANLNTWVGSAIDLYLAFSATGFTMDFPSGLQVTCFDPSVVNLDPKRVGRSRWVMDSLDYIIKDTLSGNRRGRGRARIRASSSDSLPSATLPPPPPVLSTAGTTAPTARPFQYLFEEAVQVMPSWSGEPKLNKEDCQRAAYKIIMVTWFYTHAGLFFQKPYVFNHYRCALGIFLTNPPPPTNSQPLFLHDDTNLEVMLFALMIRTLNDHGVPGYADLPNGLQLAYWDWTHVDPSRRCWANRKTSLAKCLNIMAKLQTHALENAATFSSKVPTIAGITRAAILPHQTGRKATSQTLIPEAGLAQNLEGLRIS